MVFDSVLGYTFEHGKQMDFNWLVIQAAYTVLTSSKKGETAVYD